MKFKDYKKIEKICLLRARLPSHVLNSYPWSKSDRVVYNYYTVDKLFYLAKYVGLFPDMEV